MRRQSSFRNGSSTLYLVSTPIGNLDDFTFRAIDILSSVDTIFAEDTRVSQKLLSHYQIKTPLKSYHEHNKEQQSDKIIDLLHDKHDVAIISDAGTPVVSDPGYLIAKKAMDHGFNVVSIPGASAVLSALVVSGLAPIPFTFYGFLSHKESKKKKELEHILMSDHTSIVYESPHRIRNTVEHIMMFDPDRNIVIARELTKRFEEVISGLAKEVYDQIEQLKGEIVLLIEGNKRSELFWEQLNEIEHVEYYKKQGMTEKEAIKKTAKDRKVQKNEVYKHFVK